MTERFVKIDRSKLCGTLESKGFSVDPDARGELVYVRQHHIDPTMFVKIYTSLPINGADSRGKGEDAIRVLLTFKNPKTGAAGCLFKPSRVYRTGTEDAVIERTLERARDAYREANARAAKFKNK